MTYAYTRTKKVRELRKRRVIFIVALQIEWIQKISIRYGIHIKYATNINRFIVDLFLWCSLEFSNKYTKQKKNTEIISNHRFESISMMFVLRKIQVQTE